MRRRFISALLGSAVILVATSASAAAQEVPPPAVPTAETGAPQIGPDGPAQRPDMVFDDAWVSLGVGAGMGPSYTGSDDYVLIPAPIFQGKIGGVSFSPRPAGLAVNVLSGASSGKIGFSFGPAFRLRSDRANQIEDEIVELAGELETAFEVGAAAGVSLSGVMSQFDSLSFGVDTRWDVAGAHSGMVVEPSVTYFTPLSRGIATSLSVSAAYGDDSFNDYYFTVGTAQSAASGLATYQADGGFNSLGTNLLLAVDLDGNLQNGGLSVVAITGYSRLLGDAKATPYTSVRGSADQFIGIAGIAYTF
jgi:outer membrane protein